MHPPPKAGSRIKEHHWLQHSEIGRLLAALGYISPESLKGECHDVTKRCREAVAAGRLNTIGPSGPWQVTESFAKTMNAAVAAQCRPVK